MTKVSIFESAEDTWLSLQHHTLKAYRTALMRNIGPLKPSNPVPLNADVRFKPLPDAYP